jgi:hypothetical protein
VGARYSKGAGYMKRLHVRRNRAGGENTRSACVRF